MIISKSVDDIEYPTNGNFKVQGYCFEKIFKHIKLLNNKTYKMFNFFITIEQLLILSLVIIDYLRQDSSVQLIALFASLYFLGLIVSLFCCQSTIQNIKRQADYLLPRILTNLISLFATLICALPCLILANSKQLLKYQHRLINNFDQEIILQNIICHKKYITLTQLQIVVKLYAVSISLSYDLQESIPLLNIFHWLYFAVLFLLNMIIIQQVLKQQFLLKFESNQQSSTQVKQKDQNTNQKKQKSNFSICFWEFITYFETFIQMSQTLIFLLICIHNTLIATVVIAVWCLFSFFYCYQNIFELFSNNSAEVNTSRSIFLGYRIDYLYSLYSQEFYQLRIYQSMSNMIKIAFVILYKITIIVISLLYFQKIDETISQLNIAIFIADILIFLVKSPIYFLIFFKNSNFCFSVQIRPNSLTSQVLNDVNSYNKFINVIVYHPIKNYTKSQTAIIESLLSQQDKVIYFEIYDQIRIYNKFGHFEAHIIKFSEPLYEWVSTRLKDISKSIRVQIFSIYNNKNNIIKLTKDQLIQILFDPSLKNINNFQEVINSLPFNYFPRKQLQKVSVENSRTKIFSQLIAFQRHFSPFLINNTQQILYDLIEM
ncbi:hypothetical protein ABPG72_011713 [Tetrahymena utriculariae]